MWHSATKTIVAGFSQTSTKSVLTLVSVDLPNLFRQTFISGFREGGAFTQMSYDDSVMYYCRLLLDYGVISYYNTLHSHLLDLNTRCPRDSDKIDRAFKVLRFKHVLSSIIDFYRSRILYNKWSSK